MMNDVLTNNAFAPFG